MRKNEILEITNHIYIIRDQKVMLDRDLAELYGTSVSRDQIAKCDLNS